ncbi:MAG TPA: bifunctional demethylmenaquinone methyltransferase/2-methoxy-6-polyprenyl-1,4-benzoquinol methylase UbiE [Burkholderiales bacterium]|nr:bifunctional demethylmenaquinone methyltransferase/2-methoxy-6-polyprenyl-1,4-benzoquinol methylase UbiE [Burkholderiales bacterium]
MTTQNQPPEAAGTTDFGFREVREGEKAAKVAGVFSSVAGRYDLMNDLMSGGLHRLWKRFAVELSGVRRGGRVLDVAGGTGDMSALFAPRVGPQGEVWLTDINADMLGRGRDRLLDAGRIVPAVQCDAERLPLPDAYFDCAITAFGLRNMTHKPLALAEMARVVRAGGRVLVLEFSRVWAPLRPAYDAYSFNVLPWLGRLVAGDADSYRYLAESIRRHPDQEELKALMEQAGCERVRYYNLAAGVVALHVGHRF